MNQAGCAERLQDLRGLPGAIRRVRRNSGVERFPAADDVIERAHRFFQRRFGVWPMVIKDVHVIQSHSAETLIDARQ